jgi:hypothetical protein
MDRRHGDCGDNNNQNADRDEDCRRIYGPVAEHRMIVLKPKVPRRRLNWSLSCTVNAPSMIPAMKTVVVIVKRSDIGPHFGPSQSDISGWRAVSKGRLLQNKLESCFVLPVKSGGCVGIPETFYRSRTSKTAKGRMGAIYA